MNHDPLCRNLPQDRTQNGMAANVYTHDSLCPCSSHKQPHIQHLSGVCHYCQCDLIAKVRESERSKAVERMVNMFLEMDTSISDWDLYTCLAHAVADESVQP